MQLWRVEDSVFQQVLGEPTRAVEDAVIAHRLVGERSLSLVTDRIAALFEASKGDVLKVLGVSRTKLSRNPEMDVEILDRAGSTLKVFARIAGMVGEQSAARWFTKTNRHLGGQRPLDLLSTHLGRERVEDLVTALEDGVFL
jgi:putative toxin-antitoxin system antitoxin component (TIGR02293 family)